MDWQALFARSQQWGREHAEWQLGKGHETPPERLPKTFAPATEEQIAREEARLGARLPPSLRAFYLESNGYGLVGSSIWAVRGVEQIGWLRDVVPFLYDILFEDDPASARSLVVSGESDASWWLLDPGDVDARGEWNAGRWSSWNPGMLWQAKDFFGMFEKEVAMAERLLRREKFPPPPPGTGRHRNETTIGDPTSNVAVFGRIGRNGWTYVRTEGFTSIVTISAPAKARVGEWVILKADRRSGPWNRVRPEEVWEDELSFFEPPLSEQDVAGNLSWNIDPPAGSFNTNLVPGTENGGRAVMFDSPGIYKLKGYSCYPLPVYSNEITIEVT